MFSVSSGALVCLLWRLLGLGLTLRALTRVLAGCVAARCGLLLRFQAVFLVAC